MTDLQKSKENPEFLEETKTGYLIIPHEQFEGSAISNDCASYFVEGYGLLEIVGNCEHGIVLEGIDHCGDMLRDIEFVQAYHLHLESVVENWTELYGKIYAELSELRENGPRLEQQVKALRSINDELRSEIRQLKAALDESAENGGVWMV